MNMLQIINRIIQQHATWKSEIAPEAPLHVDEKDVNQHAVSINIEELRIKPQASSVSRLKIPPFSQTTET